MSIAQEEAVACLRILAAVARADGSVHHDERKSLSAALASLDIPTVVDVDTLLTSDVDVAAELTKITSAEARSQIYRSVYFMAYADGTCTDDERAIVELVGRETGVAEDTRTSLARLFAQNPGSAVFVRAISNPRERAAAIKKTILVHATLTSLLGAFPVPGLAVATDLAVVALQVKMVRDIARFWNHNLDAPAARSMLYGVGLGTGARLAVNNLAKLIPGWGSAVGATTSFASTYALGKVIEKLYAYDATVDVTALKVDFEKAEREGKALYVSEKDALVGETKSKEAALASLAAARKDGTIDQIAYEKKVAELA